MNCFSHRILSSLLSSILLLSACGGDDPAPGATNSGNGGSAAANTGGAGGGSSGNSGNAGNGGNNTGGTSAAGNAGNAGTAQGGSSTGGGGAGGGGNAGTGASGGTSTGGNGGGANGAVSKDIGPEGGTLIAADGGLSVTVPPNALSSIVTLSIVPNSNPLPGAVSTVYDIGPTGTEFAIPIELAFSSSPDLFSVTNVPSAIVGVVSNDVWRPLSYGSFDPASSIIRGYTTHLSEYGIIPKEDDLNTCCDQSLFDTCGWLTGWEVDASAACTAHYGQWDNTKFDQLADCYDPADSIFVAGNCQRECCMNADGWISSAAPDLVSCQWYTVPGDTWISDSITQVQNCWQSCEPRVRTCEVYPSPSGWQTANSISGIAFDSLLNLYVLVYSWDGAANMAYHTVNKVDPQGGVTTVLDPMQILPPFHWIGSGIAVGQNGDVFVPVTSNDSTTKAAVCKVVAGACETIFVAAAGEQILDLVASPVGNLIVGLVDDNMFPNGLRIVEISPSGEVLNNYTGLSSGSAVHGGVAVDGAGQIYFATYVEPVSGSPQRLCRLENGTCSEIASLSSSGSEPRWVKSVRATPSGYLVAVLQGSDYDGATQSGGGYLTRVVFDPNGTELERVSMVEHVVYPESISMDQFSLAVSAAGIVARTPLHSSSQGDSVIIEPLLLNGL